MTPIEKRARAYATEHHAGQYYGNQPYAVHLNDVRNVCMEFGLPTLYLTAAWLHDVLEDTNVDPDDIEQKFGRQVFKLVEAVTGRGENRAARNLHAMNKMRRLPRAITLKLADRIANVRACLRHDPSGKLKLYVDEWDGFQMMLRNVGGHADMWTALEHLIELGRLRLTPDPQ